LLKEQFKEELNISLPALFALIVLLIVLGITRPEIFSVSRLSGVLMYCGILGIVTIGQFFVIIAGGTAKSIGLDVSIGNLMFFTVIFAGALIKLAGLQGLPVILLTLLMGICVGIINGALSVYVKIPPFITTAGMSMFLYGVTLGWGVQSGPDQAVKSLGGFLFNVPVPFILFLILLGFSEFILRRSVYGFKLLLKSSNVEAARLSGINVERITLTTYVTCSLMAVIAGLCYYGNTGFPSMRFSDIYTLESIAAVLIGGNLFESGKGSLLGVFAGALFFGFLSVLLQSFGIPDAGRKILSGIILVLLMLVFSRYAAIQGRVRKMLAQLSRSH